MRGLALSSLSRLAGSLFAGFSILLAAGFALPALAEFNLGLSYQSLGYSQTGANGLNETAIGLNGDFAHYSGRWELHAMGDATLLPLSGGSPADLRVFNGDATAGYAIAGGSRSRLSLLAGLYYSTTFAGGQALGYANALFGEASVNWVHAFRGGGLLDLRGRLMPQLNGSGGTMGYGMGGDLRYVLNSRRRHPWSVILDYTRLNVSASGATGDLHAFSVGLALGL